MRILFGLAIFSGLILIHELGHFWVARLFKIPTPVFSIGFGKRLFGLKIGNTDFRVSLIPLGGYVSFHEEGQNSLESQPWYARVCVASAGVIMNLLVAIALFTAAYMIGGEYIVNDGTGAVIEEIQPGSPAELAGLKPFDFINRITVNGKIRLVRSQTDVMNAVQESAGKPISIRLRRGLTYLTQSTVPVLVHTKDGAHYRLGIAFAGGMLEQRSFPSALLDGFWTTERCLWAILTITPNLVWHSLSTGDGSQMSSPIGIVSAGSAQMELGLATIVIFAATISISLAAINILPVPLLDGWLLVKVICETVIRRRLSKEFEEYVLLASLFIFISLTAILVFSDTLKLLLA